MIFIKCGLTFCIVNIMDSFYYSYKDICTVQSKYNLCKLLMSGYKLLNMTPFVEYPETFVKHTKYNDENLIPKWLCQIST